MVIKSFLIFLLLIPLTSGVLEIEEGISECIPVEVVENGVGVTDATVTTEIWLEQALIDNGSSNHFRNGTYCYNTSTNWEVGIYLAVHNVSFTDGNTSIGSTTFEIYTPDGEQIGTAILLTVTGTLIYIIFYRKKGYMRLIANLLFIAISALLFILYESDVIRAIGLILALMSIGSFIWDYFTPIKVKKYT